MIKPARFNDKQELVLKRFEEAGGVVDFQVFDLLDDDVRIDALHKQTVLEGMKQIRQYWDDYAARTSKQMSIPKSKVFQVSVDWERAKQISGTQVDHKTFLGARYDFERSGLIVRGKGNKFLNEFFFYRDEATKENIIDSVEIDDGIGAGFAYAFSSPPYGMRVPSEVLGELFEQVNHVILGGVDNTSVIFAWPTDWSNYFDAGHEWWGSFLWTVSKPDSHQIVMIAASSTD